MVAAVPVAFGLWAPVGSENPASAKNPHTTTTTTTVPTTTTLPTTTTAPTTTTTTTPGSDPVVLAAGDIASCSSTGDSETAAVLAGQTGTVLTLGDNEYDNGTSTEFTNCYQPTWGAQKSRTKPSPGNHDYGTAGAAGYYGYFGAAAGDPAKGYYSYDLGNRHLVSLNSNCSVVSCAAGSTQEQWLRTVDTTRGIRSFVAGTGGRSHYSFGTPITGSEVRNGTTFGVLKLTLHAGTYDWQFLPVAGGTFTDSGTGACH